MQAEHKRILKAIILELRHILEGRYDAQGKWRPGDLEQRLAALGVRRGHELVAVDRLAHLTDDDRYARKVLDAYLHLRSDAGISNDDAITEFVRETAYTWANRLLALRCMEARELIDEVILQKEAYGGRSLEHHRLAQRQPELCTGEDGGLFAALNVGFAKQAEHLPLLFDPKAPGIALRPSAAIIKRCIGLLSGTIAAAGADAATNEVFKAPDALGWAYQYWNTEEKDRVFEKVRTQKGAKIEGSDIIPATQLYTEPYMVKFLVQNSLGATWMGMHPESKLAEQWEYYVKDADRAPVQKKPVKEITFLDPACGSGHFLLEAFDLFYAMYVEEGRLNQPEEICASILKNNLFGIDIDERAVQIAEVALWMKAAEKAFDFKGTPANLVATNIRLPRDRDHLQDFLNKYPDEKPLEAALQTVFAALQHADELGSLLQIEEPVEAKLQEIKKQLESETKVALQRHLFKEHADPIQRKLPLDVQSYDDWRARTLDRLKAHFAQEAESADPFAHMLGHSESKAVMLFDLLARRYDVVAANPPYMGSKNMGPSLKAYTATHYYSGRRDLYAVFILRCQQLSMAGGRVGMVTRHSWMFFKYFEGLRDDPSHGILTSGTLECLVHLGPHAFAEIGGEIVSTVMFTWAIYLPVQQHLVKAFRIIRADSAEAKSRVLLSCIVGGGQTPLVFMPKQDLFLHLPLKQMLYWLSGDLLRVFRESQTIRDFADLPAREWVSDP